MIWKKLIIKNFLSIQEATVALDGRGLILIEGVNKTNGAFKSNGSGKTSLLEGIVYAIYDTTSKGLKADDVINNIIKKNTEVILEGVKGSDTYRIERYRKHSKHKNKVLLFVNDKEITEKSAKDTNATIERLVGIDYNTFINSILFSQGTGAGRFATATDKEKKEILENVVNLAVYATAQEVAKSRIKNKQEEINNNLRATERLNWELSNVDMLEQQDQESYKQTKQMLQGEMDNMTKTVDALSEYCKTNITTVNEVMESLEELKAKRENAINVDLSSYTNDINQEYLSLQNKINEQQRITVKKDEIVVQYKKVASDTHCPICGNELDAQHREEELAKLKSQLTELLIQLQTLTTEVERDTQTYNANLEKYQKLKESHDATNTAYRAIVDEINYKEQWLQNHEANKKQYKDRIAHIQDTVNKLSLLPEPQPRTAERKSIQDKINAQKEALLGLEREKSKLEDVVKVYSNSGVKSHVLDLITPFLNERANKYLSILTGSNIEVKFSTQKQNKTGDFVDKFEIEVHNAAGGDTYQANSEGEKKRIDLAISLAIQDLVMTRTELQTNFIGYDEVFDALDSVGSENVVLLLKERLNVVGTIFVITHSEHLKPLFEQVITVTKEKDGISSVKEGVES